jgi:hypothetical protein
MNAESGAGLGGRRQIPKAWRYVLVVVGMIAFVALFYAEEDWRGRRAWQEYQQQLARRGEPINASQVVPAPVSDTENFAMTPFLAPLFEFEHGTQRWSDTNAVAEIQAFPREFSAASSEIKHDLVSASNSWVPRPIDLKAWDLALQQTTNSRQKSETRAVANNVTAAQAAAGVLSSLAQYDRVIEELRTASRRPYSRFNLAYDFPNPAAILLPHLAFLKRTSQLLQVRACAELAAGQTGEAVADMNLMFYLADCIRDEPILISHLVRIAQAQLLLQPLAQGLANHQWSDAQLAAFEEQLGRFNFCAEARRALEGERVFFGGGFIDYIRKSPDKFRVLESIGGAPGQPKDGFEAVAAIYAIAPDGWLDFEKVNYHRAFEELVLPAFDHSAGRVNPEVVRKAAERFEQVIKHRGPGMFLQHRFFAGFLLPAVTRAVERSAYGQAAIDLAAIACALERCRLAQGAYPDSLEPLAPRFIAKIPYDLITGGSLKYRLTEDGQYVLYSVGWNEKDDGGAVAINKTGHAVSPDEGDWVWRLIPKQATK